MYYEFIIAVRSNFTKVLIQFNPALLMLIHVEHLKNRLIQLDGAQSSLEW